MPFKRAGTFNADWNTMLRKPELRWGLFALAFMTAMMYWFQARRAPPAPMPDQVLTYKRIGSHALQLHVFRPHGTAPAAGSPAILFLHGGGWQFGDPRQFFPQCDYFRTQGMVCVSAAYRIASVHSSSPADALQDARDALRYLRRHAAALGLAADRIVAAGGSAGGHLAASLATAVPMPDANAGVSVSTRPNALVLLNPILNLAPGQPDHAAVAAYWRDISPLHHIDRVVPPTLILSGEADAEVPVATLKAFCRAMQQLGGHCEIQLYPRARHGFFNPEVDRGRYFEATNQAAVAFLRRQGFLSEPGARSASPPS